MKKYYCIINLHLKVAVLEAKWAKTVLLKQGMMQELLSGRVRLV